MKKFKEMLNKANAKLIAAGSSALAIVAPGYCTGGDYNGAAANVITMVFNLITMGGIVLTAMGVVQLVRCIISLTGGDQLQPGALGKALGMIIAGIVAATLKPLLGALGIPTDGKIFG